MKKEDAAAVLRRELKARHLQSAYLFYGEEEYLKRHYIREIVRLFESRFGAPDVMTLGEDFSRDAFEDAVETLTMGAAGRVIVLQGVEIALLQKADAVAVMELLEHLPQEVVVILSYDDAYLTGDFERKKKREARLRELSKHCYTVEFPIQSHASLMNWAGRRLAAAGVTADEEALDYLLSRCDNKMTALAGELEKLAVLCGGKGGGRVTRADVQSVAMPALAADIYEIVSCMTQRDYAGALRRLDACRKNRENPVAVTAALGTAFCELLFSKAAADAGKTDVEAVLSDFKIRPSKRYFIRQYLRAAGGMDREYVQMAVRVLAEVDALQKSSAADPWLLLEQGMERIHTWKS